VILLVNRESNETITHSDALELGISGVEEFFDKITPTSGAEFSVLGTTVFEVLDDLSWTTETIGRMDEALHYYQQNYL